MFVSKIKSRYIKLRKGRICQGDILRDLSIVLGGGDYEALEVELPYSIVMTQDCDLEHDADSREKNKGKQSQDINNDKYLLTLLVCPAYVADSFFQGTHITNWKMQPIIKGGIDKVKRNDELKRYHFLEGQLDLGVPDLVADFKHFYTVPRDIVYKQRKQAYLVTISELFRENLSQRFANYLSRIGLPEF